MLSFLESAVPLLMVPLLTGAYNMTIASFPGAVFVIISGLNLIVFALMLIIRWVSDPTPIYQTLDEEDADDVDNNEETESTEGQDQVIA